MDTKKPFGTDDFSTLDGSLQFDAPDGFEIKLADISWVKRKFLDIPYASQSPAQRLDLYLPDEGDGPFPWWCIFTAAALVWATNGTTTWTPTSRA